MAYKKKFREKSAVDKSCFEMAVERVELCFERYDRTIVLFSGGKDSTACLNIAVEAARRVGRLPLDVVTYDEEAIPPQTVEYMARVAKRPELRFHWYCLPIKHRNACSSKEPYWYPWAPEDEAKWVRPLPPGAITEADAPAFKRGMSTVEATPALFGPENGTVCAIMGIRCQESLTRYRAIVGRDGPLAFISKSSKEYGDAPWLDKAYPIYDWTVDDVWLAPHLFGWDTNAACDVMTKAGVPVNVQRCSPPFGDQPIRHLWKYKTCWPELWAAMSQRVHGAATAARYANTELYGVGVRDSDLPEGQTWKEASMARLAELKPDAQREVAAAMKTILGMHAKLSSDPMPDAEQHPVTGFSWKILYVIPKVGSDKFNRQMQKVMAKALEVRRGNEGLTLRGHKPTKGADAC